MLILLALSLPFLVAAGFCFVMAERTGAWTNLGWAIYGALALGLWALVVLGFFLWLMARDGWLAWHGIPLALIVLALLGIALWGGRWWLAESRCRADAAFYGRLVAAPMAERAAMIDGAPRTPAQITPCGREMLDLHLIADRFHPPVEGSPEEAGRLATLALLLDRGLPADDTLLFQAVAGADPALVRLLVERRQAAGQGVPPRFVEQALGEIETDPTSPYHDALERYLAILRIFRDAGFDACLPMSATSTFRDEMMRKGVPADLLGPAC